MRHPLTKTFDFLATTSRSQAHEVLLAALDLPDEPVREHAVEAMLRRDSPLGHVEVIRRYCSLNTKSQDLVVSKSARIKKAIEETFRHGDVEQRGNVAQLVLAAERFEHLTTLIQLVEEDPAAADWGLPVFREMVSRLYDHCRTHAESNKTGSYLKNAPRVQRDVLAALDKSWPKIENREIVEVFWEAILVLAGWESGVLKSILTHIEKRVRLAAWEIVSTSTQPGVMQLPCDALSLSSPNPRAIEILTTRSDPQFIAHLLRWLPKPITQPQKINLRKIEGFRWLDSSNLQLELIPEGLQCALVRLVKAIRLGEDEQLAIYEWLIRHGSLDARLSATGALASMRDGLVQSFLVESLESADADVQAWATGQLRECNVPDAIPILLDRLDSSVNEVREIARSELHSFDLQQALEWFETLSERACHRLGEVLQKIDPFAISRLVAELHSPVQRRRLRATHAALALNLHLQVVEDLLSLLEDEDIAVRRCAVEVLGNVPASEVITGIDRLLQDPDARVRESADEALANIKRLIRQQ